MDNARRLALLIDGDNAQATLLPQILAEVNRRGTATIRRVYGDWTEPEMKGWKDTLNEYAIHPVQQFRYTKGKNATDSALIIDAMDILYSAGIDGYCLVSSDSDYTRLATRIREKDLFVLGIGKRSTPEAFVNACNEFVYTDDLLKSADTPDKVAASPGVEPTAAPVPPASAARPLQKLLAKAFELAVQDDGWATLAAVGGCLRQLDPGFDPRTYGHKQLSQLAEAHPDFIEVKKTGSKGGIVNYHVRRKKR